MIDDKNDPVNLFPEDQYPDFLLTIDFPKQIADPQRIFSTASAYIEALHECDKMLLKSINSDIKPVFVLEQVENGSLKIWLKQFLDNVPDDALRTGNLKILLGQYLIKGKYLLLKILNQRGGLPDKKQLEEI